MTKGLPAPRGSQHYNVIPFRFTEELSSKNVFLRLPSEFSPLERMLLQASGNLQRILSAYYNVPSRVEIIMNKAVPDSELDNGCLNQKGTPTGQRFERKINMYFADKFVYEAESVLYVKDENVLELIEKHKYGLGQIFG
ncbi:hypothetical protein EC973_000816 [Apophysomyces ossiformis]|uniref:Uncharacterized protein n=1 Tax=Apophysomyces ossiformis TaxID=679940 RepID=A0A8H7EMW2_9FUNG|nr:hypothetical protein EC973_000816 [Apophysomyces ossiformis]